METIPYSQIEKGTFLIAAPEVEKGIFFRSVVLICEHNATGSFGLVVNKPLELELPQEIVNVSTLTNPNMGIYAGGPMQTNQMMLLHSCSSLGIQTLKICDGVYLGGDLQFLQDILTQEEGPHVHLSFGYTGWGAGQLEREFLNGSWYVWPANENHIFYTQPEKLWGVLLREMGGKYSSLSMIPEDLSLN